MCEGYRKDSVKEIVCVIKNGAILNTHPEFYSGKTIISQAVKSKRRIAGAG